MSDVFEKIKESKEPTQAQVFELLGRLLYVCNVIELRLRWMYKHRGGIWTGKTFEELINSMNKAVDDQQKENKSPLGTVGRKIFDAIYTPRCNKDIKAAEKKNLFACKMDVNSTDLLKQEIIWFMALQEPIILQMLNNINKPTMT